MGHISILPPLVAERIAAGEVVERPASIVKEAVENAIDAGATEIHVRLEEGGKSSIEILDNGRGMDSEDLQLCALRHATSKLRSVEDLERIVTLGFRGEALPSIAAVSDFEIISRTRGSSGTHRLTMDAEGRPRVEPTTFGHFLGGDHGTRLTARSLFSQVPARLKFLKSQAAEVSQVREWLERLALTHPEISFRLESDGRMILNLKRGSEEDRVRAILADGEDYPLVHAEIDPGLQGGAIRGKLFWVQGLSVSHARKLVQVINGRAVRDRLVQQALLSPFRQALLPGQFPAAFLRLAVPPADIDVNVHPAKTELRFMESGRLFKAVERLATRLITDHGVHGYAAGPTTGASPSWADSQLPEDRSPSAFAPSTAAAPLWQARSPGTWSPPAPEWNPPPPGGWSTAPAATAAAHTPSLFATSAPASSAFSESEAAPSAGTGPAESLLAGSRYAGSLFQTYLLLEKGDDLWLVDQHAAHERIRYEQLRASVERGEGMAIGSQALLLPEAVHFEPEQRALIEARLAGLEQLGFEAELFGETSLLFRSVPSAWGLQNLRVRLKNLVTRLMEFEPENPTAIPPHAWLIDELLFERLASQACRSSVRAGDLLDDLEAARLVTDLQSCAHPWNCPHGRPTLVKLPRSRFEEWFQRRV
jgi:DNA mismatch repair protein MutL